MPSLQQEVTMTFEVWCANHKSPEPCCFHTTVEGDQVTIACPACLAKAKELKELKKKLRGKKDAGKK